LRPWMSHGMMFGAANYTHILACLVRAI